MPAAIRVLFLVIHEDMRNLEPNSNPTMLSFRGNTRTAMCFVTPEVYSHDNF